MFSSCVQRGCGARLRGVRRTVVLAAALLLTLSHRSVAQETGLQQAEPAPPPTAQPSTTTVSCASKIGERHECSADTSKGIVLARSYGQAACLLGKTWGYDDKSVWVSDGCVADFVVAGVGPGPPSEPTRRSP